MSQDRAVSLKREIEARLPGFADACQSSAADTVLLHQDAFAFSLDEDEYLLLGKAIKYAGIMGKHVEIVANKRTTHPDPQTTAIQTCKHDRLNEDGVCRSCGTDQRGIG